MILRSGFFPVFIGQFFTFLWKAGETLPIINKPKHPKDRGNTRIKMQGPTCKKTKEPPNRPNHKGNIKFLNPLLSPEAGSEL
jgi:hypothetical protein